MHCIKKPRQNKKNTPVKHNVKTTSYRRRCGVDTTLWRRNVFVGTYRLNARSKQQQNHRLLERNLTVSWRRTAYLLCHHGRTCRDKETHQLNQGDLYQVVSCRPGSLLNLRLDPISFNYDIGFKTMHAHFLNDKGNEINSRVSFI